MNKRILQPFLFFTLFALLNVACTNTSLRRDATEEKQTERTPAQEQLREKLMHFWDEVDFKNDVTAQDTGQTEQLIANFIYTFEHARPEDIQDVIANLFDRASVNERNYGYFQFQFERYLYDPNSPMRNDEYFEYVLNYLVQSEHTHPNDKVRFVTLLDIVRKNKIGNPISDLEYETVTGSKHHIHDNTDTYKLIVFYDPNCPHCEETIQALKHSPELRALIQNKYLKVIAIYPLGARDIWLSYNNNIPDTWINGFDEKKVAIEKGLFDLKAFPTIFFVDKNNHVILKDTELDFVLQYFSKM